MDIMGVDFAENRRVLSLHHMVLLMVAALIITCARSSAGDFLILNDELIAHKSNVVVSWEHKNNNTTTWQIAAIGNFGVLAWKFSCFKDYKGSGTSDQMVADREKFAEEGMKIVVRRLNSEEESIKIDELLLEAGYSICYPE